MKVSPRELATMTRRMSDLVGGGLTVRKSLLVLSAQSENKNVRSLLKNINQDVADGKSLSESFGRQNGFFSPVYAGMVRAGESSGNLESSLNELAGLLEADLEIAQRTRAALAYPLALAALAAMVCFFLTVFVIPRFELLFQDLGQQLPWPTRALIRGTAAMRDYGWLVAIAAVGAALLMKRDGARAAGFRMQLVRLPVVFDLFRNACLSRWTRVMASLLGGGVPVPQALRLSRQTADALVFGPEIDGVASRLREGQSLSRALSRSAIFPPMLCELVGAGEESGSLEKTFERLAETYKRESEISLKFALSMLEPVLVLLMGVVVGFVAVAMLLPIFEMSAKIR